MCGIFGFNFEDKELLKKIHLILQHRGPNDHGYYTDKNISLGHNRLSILDLSKKGHQPMIYKHLTIIFNGEIYNFKEIKEKLKKHRFISNSDTEVILHAYEEYGTKCLDYFNGMFAFCIYDKKKNILFLARDRLGIKPLYYYHKNNKFIFSSEIKAILQDKEIKREINKYSLDSLLTFRYVINENTILNDIKKLLPGHYMIFDLKKDKIINKEYWDINFSYSESNPKKLKQKLSESVKKRLISDVPLGALLSGGIDSSVIVALMKEHTDNIKTFTIGFEGEKDNEFEYARLIADKFNTEHHEIMIKPTSFKLLPEIIYHMDEPVGDLTTIPAYNIFKEAKKYVTVLLMGEGSDEILMGYEQYRIMKFSKTLPFKNIFSNLIKILPNEAAFNKLSKFLTNNDLERYYHLIAIFNQDEKKKVIYKNYNDDKQIITSYFNKTTHYLNKIMYFELKTWLPNDILLRSDRMTMAHSLEGRVPFLDHNVVEFASKIHPNLKLKQLNEKYILKKSMQNIFPKSIIKRKKQRFFTPVDHWFGNELRNIVYNLTQESEIIKKYFNTKYIQNILDYPNKYSYKFILKHNKLLKHYYSRQLWNLLTFNTWYEIFINKRNPKTYLLYF